MAGIWMVGDKFQGAMFAGIRQAKAKTVMVEELTRRIKEGAIRLTGNEVLLCNLCPRRYRNGGEHVTFILIVLPTARGRASVWSD